MSINSKAKRDARKKKQTRASHGNTPKPTVQTHAQLAIDDAIIGGAGLHGNEWVLILGGKALASTDSAAMILAMLKHAASISEHEVALTYSATLGDAATREAEALGHTLDEYLGILEAERLERKLKDDEADASGGSTLQ